MKQFIKKITPAPLLSAYHYCAAYYGAIRYGFPSNKLVVIGITGTKGKSTTAELVAAILKEAGYTVALASTIRFAIGEQSEPNLFKMTMPGRTFLQEFLRKAVNKGATHAVVEMTSEGAKQYRHKGIALNALVFTNLQPEHLESHGGMAAYAAAKLSLAKHLEDSSKRPRYIVANADDKYGKDFLAVNVEVKAPFSLKDAEPYSTDEKSVRFVWRRGELFTVPLPGLFNLQNILAALTLTDAMGIPQAKIKKALERIAPVAGRAERIERGQPFTVVVDYAHTPDSLRAIFSAYSGPTTKVSTNKKLIGIIGSTGGGRDTWNRPEKGKIAEQFCDITFIANEDPYDEDPQKIVQEIAKGFSSEKPHVILDRRKAIREALREAKEGDVVVITGKGTDPYIMGPNGTKELWSDKRVAEEELKKLGYHK
jgi:UDP-N-acetylmuramoyl-L-alanyl-D-glutamate--2,6-diaminopimelate ligase